MKKFLAFIFTIASALSVYGQGSVRTVQTISQLLAINPAAVGVSSNTVYSVLNRDSSTPFQAARTFRNWRGTAYTTNIANTFAAVDGTQWVADDRFSSSQDPTWWYVDMTGVADSTANFQAMVNLSPAKELDVPIGSIKLTSVVITNAGLNLRGHRTTILPAATNAPIWIAANDTIIQGFVFDGQTNFPSGIAISSNILNTLITHNTFVNFNSKTNPLMCVPIYTLGGGGLIVTANTLSNLQATPNGIVGDRAGMVRAVSIESPFSSGLSGEAPLYVEVSKNYISYLDTPSAEDSDGVVITGAPASWQGGSGNGIIAGNWFWNVGKRPVKVSASGYLVQGNWVGNNYDGSTQPSGWAGTAGIKRQYAAIGSSYGSKNTWSENTYFGGAYEQAFDMASNAISASFTKFIGNTVKFNPSITFTNATCDGITSLQAAATNVIIANNDFDVVRSAFVSYPLDKGWDVGNNIFRHVNSNGKQVYDYLTDTWTTGGTGFQIGPSITNYNIYYFSSPSNVAIANALGHKIHNNVFDNFTSIGIIYRGTNMALTDNLTINGTGDYGVQTKVPANYYDVTTNKLLDEWITNTVSGNYTYINNSKFFVAGDKRNPYQWFPLEVHGNPLLISTPAFYDETYTLAGNTNVGQLAMFSDPNRLGFTVKGWTNGTILTYRSNVTYTASNYVILQTNLTVTITTNTQFAHWEFPETFTYKSIAGATNGNWYRVATAVLPGYYNTERYGARVRIGSAGGAWATFDQEFRVGASFGLPFLEMTRNVPGITGFGAAARIVYDTNGIPNNTICYLDIQASGSSVARWTVQVQPEFASTYLLPELQWHVAGCTNVASLSATETVKLTIASTTDQTYHFVKGTQEYYDAVEGVNVRRYLTNASTTMDFRTPNLQHNGTNVMREQTGSAGQVLTKTAGLYAWSNIVSGTTYSFGTGLTNVGTNVTAMLAAGANVTFTTNGQTITIASTGSGSGPTNGSAVYVDSTGVSVANFVDSAELNPTYSGTNLTYAIVANSIATNKIDSTFYTWIDGKQSALSFTNGVTNSAGTVQLALLAGSNITLSTNAGAVTISSSGGGGSTNGSAVFVDAVYQSAPNFADSSELNVTVSGTNATYSIVANSIATNKIDSTFYNFINNKQSALSFSTGTTNSNGTVTAALAAGTNVVLTTNANTITINSTATGGGGSGYLPLTAGSLYPLTGNLHFLRPSSPTQIILGNEGDITDGRKYLGVQSTGGKFQVFDMDTNTFTVAQTLLNIDTATDSVTNYYYFGTSGGKEDWITFYSERFIIPTGTLEVGGTNVMAAINSNRTKTLAHWTARDYIPNAANSATFSSRSVYGSLVPSITFDPTTQQGTSFEAAMPEEDLNLTNGVAIKLYWSTPLASAGSNIVWSVTVTNLCCGSGVSTNVLVTNAPSGVANEVTNSIVLMPSMFSLTPNGMIKVYVDRVAGSASDVNPLTNELRAVKLYIP